jgi:hypothetical protein
MGRERNMRSNTHTNSTCRLMVDRASVIYNKVQKKSNFQILIFFFRFEFKRRSKQKPEVLRNLIKLKKWKLQFGNFISSNLQFSTEFQVINLAVCFEIGKQIYLEKEFYYIYQFSNLKNPEIFIKITNFRMNSEISFHQISILSLCFHRI